MHDWLVLAAVLVLPLLPILPDLWLGWVDRRAPASVRLEVDAAGVRRTFDDGVVEGVAWAELQQVGVLASAEDLGPIEVYLLLYGPDGTGVAVGADEASSHDLLSYLGSLAGFDAEAYVRALVLDTEALSTLWSRDQGAPSPQVTSTARGESPAPTKA